MEARPWGVGCGSVRVMCERQKSAGGQVVAIAAAVLYASLFGVGLADTGRISGGIVHDHGTRRTLQGSVDSLGWA